MNKSIWPAVFLLHVILLNPVIISGQCHNGKVLSRETECGIGYVSIGIVGKNVGTVSDIDGNFHISISKGFDNDSLRFSMIGYDPKYVPVRQFMENKVNQIYLDPKPVALEEVVVNCTNKKIRLGVPVPATDLRSGFCNNDLGSELGVFFSVKNRVKLRDINFSVATCTYDSVTYRLNIYELDEENGYRNILTEPIYLSFTGNDINENLTFDLSSYSIILEGNNLIAMELYKDLGEGKLLFNTRYFDGSTFHRKTAEGTWIEAPGAIGLYLNSYELR